MKPTAYPLFHRLRRVAGIVPLALLPHLAAAQDAASSPRLLPLAEAVQLALANSQDVKRNQAAGQQAGARVQQAQHGVLPSVQVSSTFLRLSNNVTPFSVAFPGEGLLVLNPQILNQSYNSLHVRQLLWAGGRVRLGIQATRHEQQATQAEAGQYRLLAADNVTGIWYELYTLTAAERILRENLRLLQERRRDLTNLERQGLVLKVDGLKLDLALSRLESTLTDLRSGQAINQFNLAVATGLPPTTVFDVGEADPATAPPLRPLADYQAEALATRAELKALGWRREAALAGQRIARGQVLPTVSVGGTADYNRPNLRVFPNEAAFKATGSVFANLTWDLQGLYTNRARVAESRFALEQVSTGLEQLRDGIQMEVHARYRAYEQALAKIRVAEQAVGQATENFRIEQNRFKVSLASATDFLDANTQLVQARLDLRTAQANAALAYWKLLKSTGREPGAAN